MKGNFLTTAVFAALLVGSSAMAGVPRVAVFGTQPTFTSTITTNAVNGALWYDDDYNVFYNPAYVNDNKNYAVVQKGMEGGWFKSEFENFAYGVYVNRGGNGAINGYNSNAGNVYGGGNLVAPGTGNLATFIGTASVVPTLRPIDLFFGGDTGLKWGVHAAWAYNRDQYAGTQPNNADARRLRFVTTSGALVSVTTPRSRTACTS
ncbi:MAG: hypothetical protein HY075_01000 [Deltaproteobacteria bacterium]|nr:hypothetical protein [Deltaproteobacteria bacterium]